MSAANATPGLSLAGLGLGYKVLTGRQGRERVLVKTTCSVRVLAEIFLRKMCIWFLPKSTLRESRKVSLFLLQKICFQFRPRLLVLMPCHLLSSLESNFLKEIQPPKEQREPKSNQWRDLLKSTTEELTNKVSLCKRFFVSYHLKYI